MNTFFTKIEEALSDYAEQFTPEGSEVKAVVHQWIHAIAYNNPLFASDKKADEELVIKKLKAANITNITINILMLFCIFSSFFLWSKP